MGTFKAIRIDKAEKGTTAALTQFDEADLMEGDVTVRVEWSALNYKDGLAVTGKAPVVRRFPMIAGIDLAGIVEQSSHPQWKAGDKVICTGWGMGETHLGAYAGKARVKGDWLVRLPEGMSTREAMAIGTAGFTAMLAVLALEKHGLTPRDGPVVVTGAAGGVGSVATAVLSKIGYHVIASTGRLSEASYLRDIGAAEVIERSELSGPAKPLAKERWAGGNRQRRLNDAGQHSLDDEIPGSHRRVRTGRRYGSAVLGGAVYFARRVSVGHRFRDVPDRVAQSRLDATRARSGSGKTI